MVMALVSELGKVRPVCLSRFYLNRALDALEAGSTIEAGCLLRESVQRYLWALCLYHDCETQRHEQHRAPGALLKCLKRDKHVESDGAKWILECIEVGNKLAHCRPVPSGRVEVCISMMHLVIDCTTGIDFPTRGGAQL